ncbi:hypothetical protein [Dongia deserti]|uniref:hypothetical protein n=1 Tax=Dongia deserti TaxID=2268030 RepID=UPI0013C4B315|nr:hypothetical protein [Dongia deserti]
MYLASVRKWLGSGLLAGLMVAAIPSSATAQGLSAIVEAISPSHAEVRAFDILAEGTVITLQPGQTLTLGYMDSCAHEEISGGRVTIGEAESTVESGTVKRTIVPCNGSVDPDSAAGANEAAVVAIRSLGADAGEVVHVVPSQQPVFVLGEGDVPSDPSLVIQRLDRQEPPIRVSLFGRTLDLKQTGMKLTPGGIYSASCGGRKMAFKIADNAGVGPVVTLQRVVRF